ncbi:MAG: hypothetical protein NVS3B16_00520 [Vulcanimicrobiaceae bacterium]
MARTFVVTIALLIALGVFFRFDRLDGKLYTNDEATTSIHVSGHTVAQYDAATRSGAIRSIGDLARFQRVDPATSVRDVVTGLAAEDAQHPPLFYVFERGWQTVFGDSIAARRALPALIGTVAIFCAYLFGLTLTGDAAFASVFAALVAVSPFHVLYAQQAREYSLWTSAILLASAALLRALAAPSPARWALYALALAVGLYTDVLFAYTLAAHALFAALAYRRQFRRALVPFALAACAALAAFSPWIAALVRGRAAITNNAYLGAPLPFKLFALKWIFNAGAVFYDLDYERHATAVLLVPIFAVVAAGAVLLARATDRRAGLFVALLAATAALAFLVPDILRHESRSTSSRYLIPTWLACECAAAYAIDLASAAAGCVAAVILLQHVAAPKAMFAICAFAGLAALGLVSLGVAAQREYWWGDAGIAPMGPIARLVRAAQPPVTLAFASAQGAYDFGPVLLADAVDPAVRLVYLQAGEVFAKSAVPGSTFALDPTAASLANAVRGGWRAEPVYRYETGDAAVAALRREAAHSRGGDAATATASLWRLR